jgi:hypothetical protein
LATFFPRQKLCIKFDKKWIGLHFLATFWQTHLVTLSANQTKRGKSHKKLNVQSNDQFYDCSLHSKLGTETRVARVSTVQHTKTGKNTPNNHKLYQMTTQNTKWTHNMYINYINWPHNIPNGNKLDRHLIFQDPPKFTQIGIFGKKIPVPSGNPGENGCFVW